MTLTFSVLLAAIFLVELGCGIGAYMAKEDVHGIVERNMEKGLLNFGKDGYKGVTETWDVVQHEVRGAELY